MDRFINTLAEADIGSDTAIASDTTVATDAASATVVGTDSADIFKYTGGQLTINDYQEGDSIQFNSDTTYVSSTVDSTSKDITLTTDRGKVVLVNAATYSNKGVLTGKKVTVIDGSGNKVTRLFGTSTITLTTADDSTINLNNFGYADVTLVDASGRKATAPVNITAQNRVASVLTDTTLTVTLKGSAGNDTFSGGTGNSVIITGNGNDTVTYTGGSDTITDYTAGKDVIQLGSGVTFASSSVDTVSKDVIINTNKGTFTISKIATVNKTGAVTGGKKVTLVDAAGNKATRIFGMTTLSIGTADSDTIDLNSNLLKDVTVADASSRAAKYPVYIIGNSYKAANTSETSLVNTIKGGKGDDTLKGGAGNDTLTGGNGNDIFFYTGGDDVITDYTISKTAGDTIKLVNGIDTLKALNGYQIVDKDVVIPFSDSDSLTILKGKDKLITFIGGNSDTKIDALSFTYTDPSIKLIDSTVTSYNFEADNLTAEQKKKITLIDASKHTAKVPIHIVGSADTSRVVTIKSGKGADTIDGNTGNNFLTGGSGKDVFIYSGGNDTITDYTAGQDTISIVDSDINIVGASISSMANTDVVFTFQKAGTRIGTLTVQNAIKKGTTAQKLTINNHGVAMTQVYGQSKLTVANTDGATINTASNTNAGVVEIVDAAKRNAKNPIYMIGNTLDNSLKGGAGDDTIVVSSGYNTLTGGKGSDLFVLDFSNGNNFTTITDYSTAKNNTDTIQIAGGSYSTYIIEGNNVIFGFGSGSSLNVTNGNNAFINFVDSAGSSTAMARVYYDAKNRIFTSSSDDATIPKYDARDTSVDPDRIFNETIDAGKRTSKNPIYILGNGNDNYIKGGAGADTLDDGNATSTGTTTVKVTDNTLTGGKGKDTFVYHGGNAVITDYAAGQDVINIARNDYTTYHISGSDVVFYFSDTTNSLTVKNTKGKKITTNINNKGDTTDTYNDYEETVISANADSIVSGLSSDLTTFVSFDASKRTAKKPIFITGNTKNNVIKGGAGDDTLTGSSTGSGTTVIKTNDTLTGGKGKDTFIYTGGNVVITDYTAGQDTIQIAGVSYSSYQVKDKDVVLSFGANTLTVSNGKDKSIDFATVAGAVAPTIATFNDYSEKIFTKSDNASYVADSDVVTISAAKMSAAMTITGNAKDNVITGGSKADDIDGLSGNNFINGGKGNDTLRGGKGNNTLTGGAGKDVFIIAADSNNTITDYTAGQDIISLESGVNVTAVTLSPGGSDYIFTVGSAANASSTLRIVNGIKKGTPQKITFETFDGKSTSQVYGQKALSIANTDGDTIDLNNNVNSSVRSVDASKRSKTGIYINGNANSFGNTLIGGSKADTIYAYETKSTINGGKGDDEIAAGIHGSSISGGAGNDDILVLGGNNNILGGDGNDTIYLETSDGANYIEGGKGNDDIILTMRSPTGEEDKGNTIVGGAGNDNITLNGSGCNIIKYTTGDGNDEINYYLNGDIIQLGSSKTAVTNATFDGNDYTFTIGKGQIKVTNVSSGTTVSIADYNGKVTKYTDATKTSAFIERNYIEDSWFTTVDSYSGVTDSYDLIGKFDDLGIVSGDYKGVSLLESDYQTDDKLLGVDIKGSGGLIENNIGKGQGARVK